MDFHEQKKHLLKNPPKEVSGWVERNANYGNYTVTEGKKYEIRGYFRYLNHYGCKGDKYPQWDEFITIKNDDGYTVKMNLRGFKQCDAPLTKTQILENKIIELENKN